MRKPPVQINIRVPANLDAALRLIMKNHGISLNKLLNELITEALEARDAIHPKF